MEAEQEMPQEEAEDLHKEEEAVKERGSWIGKPPLSASHGVSHACRMTGPLLNAVRVFPDLRVINPL